MKKLLFPLFLLGIFTFSLQSCGDDDEPQTDDVTDDVIEDNVFGEYTGVFSTDGQPATILITGIGGLDGEVLDDTPFALTAAEVAGSADSINVDITLQVTVSGSAVPVPVELNVGYDAAAKTFTRTNTDISLAVLGGAVNIEVLLVELQGAFDGADVSGSIELDDPTGTDPATNNIEATFVFSGTKQ